MWKESFGGRAKSSTAELKFRWRNEKFRRRNKSFGGGKKVAYHFTILRFRIMRMLDTILFICIKLTKVALYASQNSRACVLECKFGGMGYLNCFVSFQTYFMVKNKKNVMIGIFQFRPILAPTIALKSKNYTQKLQKLPLPIGEGGIVFG